MKRHQTISASSPQTPCTHTPCTTPSLSSTSCKKNLFSFKTSYGKIEFKSAGKITPFKTFVNNLREKIQNQLSKNSTDLVLNSFQSWELNNNKWKVLIRKIKCPPPHLLLSFLQPWVNFIILTSTCLPMFLKHFQRKTFFSCLATFLCSYMNSLTRSTKNLQEDPSNTGQHTIRL